MGIKGEDTLKNKVTLIITDSEDGALLSTVTIRTNSNSQLEEYVDDIKNKLYWHYANKNLITITEE